MLTHEVATAVRLEALKPAAGERLPAPLASASRLRNAPHVQVGGKRPPRQEMACRYRLNAGDNTKTSAKQDATMKVSLVGEKSAPLKSSEEENKLSPSERRKKVVREYYRSHIDPVGRIIAEELSKFKEEEKLVKRRLPQTLVMEELEKPRQAYIFKRGLYKIRGDNVNPATPAVLPPMAKGAPRNRLGLAQWLISSQHPLTARSW